MKKYSLLAFAAAAVVSPAVYTASYVELQPDSPGNLQTGHLNISGTAKATQVVAYSPTTTGIAYGGDFRSVSDQGRGILGNASSPTGVTYGGLFQSFSTSGRGVAGITAATSGFTVGGFFTTNSTDGKGVQGSSNAVTGLNYGVYGRNLSPDGYGVFSEGNMAASGIISGNGSGLNSVNASSLGGRAYFNYVTYDTPYLYVTSDGSSNNALKGVNGSSVDARAGVRGDETSSSGSNYGVYGTAASISGSGVFGEATASSGNTYGVRGKTNSSSGRGVFGHATANAGVNTGVYAQSDSTSGRGVVSVSSAASGSTYGMLVQNYSTTGRGGDFIVFATSGSPYALLGTSQAPTGYGVFGQNLAATGKGYGTVGRSDSPAQGWGVYCSGRFGSSGTKSFRIDHPLDPFNKFLLHYSTESPTPQNFYSGNVVTDGKGYAWVTLPDYFKEINVNFKYQLTVVDDEDSSGFVQAKVSKKIRGNQFQIRTSSPNAEVSWRIEADRNDIFVQHSKPSDVEEKEGAERGTVEFPEFYNQPADRGLFYGAKSGMAKQAK